MYSAVKSACISGTGSGAGGAGSGASATFGTTSSTRKVSSMVFSTNSGVSWITFFFLGLFMPTFRWRPGILRKYVRVRSGRAGASVQS